MNKKVTIVGLARSGMACAKLLKATGAEVSVTEINDSPSLRQSADLLLSFGVPVELARHTRDFIAGRDLVVVSPGVTAECPAVVWARQDNITVISEIEAAWLLCPATVIAVTGSGGKSTVTTLIGKIIEASGKKAFVCGNIGTPFSQEVEKMTADDFVSLEISSFQLETIRGFKPKVAVMLNFNRNHLDRHKDMQEYLEAKKRIFMNQDQGDYLVLNQADPVLREVASEARSQVRFFLAKENVVNPNQAAALAVAKILGIPENISQGVFKDFLGLPHRLEFVGEVNGIRFINDSKATLAESTVWALKMISSPVILIAGGRDKGVDYAVIKDAARGKVKKVVAIGEASAKIKNALQGFLQVEEAKTLQEAVEISFAQAEKKDTVVLSPMCSSFDMFTSYEERGEVFKNAVRRLK